MKRMFCLLLALSALLCACGTPATPTTAPTEMPTQAPTETLPAPTEMPTEPPTEAPTEPPIVYHNPLTGAVVDGPVDTRVVAVTINNVPKALPLCGINQADLFFEMYINDYATRGLALYSDIRGVERIGSVRSNRYNFTDIAQSYDAFIAHAGGSKQVINDANKHIDHMNIDTAKTDTERYSYRDRARRSSGYALEHTLFANGGALYQYLTEKGERMTQDPNKDYRLSFVQDGTPAGGEDAPEITINLIHRKHSKKSIMTYNPETGLYEFSEYGKALMDGNTGKPISFKNVFILSAKVTNQSVYHVADLDGSGEGYFACGGKIIPIQWHREDPEQPFSFNLADGSPLNLGIGSSYFAIAPLESKITW